MWSHQNLHPQHCDPHSGGIFQIQSFFLRSKGFVPSIRHPNTWDLHWGDEPPKCLALKTNGTSSRDPKCCRELRCCSKKAHTQMHLPWGPGQKQKFENHLNYMWKKSVSNHKASAKKAEPYWDSQGTEALVGAILHSSSTLLSASGHTQCLHSLSVSLKASGLTERSLIAWLWWLGELVFLGPMGL